NTDYCHRRQASSTTTRRSAPATRERQQLSQPPLNPIARKLGLDGATGGDKVVVGRGKNGASGTDEEVRLEDRTQRIQDISAVPASVALRAMAWLVDLLVVGAVVAVSRLPLAYGLPLVLLILYHTISLWLTQQTIGKAFLGLTLIRTDREPTLLWAFGRASLGYFVVDVLGLGLLAALFDPRRRCFHDHVFASRVVLEGGSASGPNLVARLVAYAEKLQSAADEKEKPYRQAKSL
ncbi:MAG: RDD family protein, partial [Egibacteraceae bacterium]